MDINVLASAMDVGWTLIAAALVFFMQAGFAMGWPDVVSGSMLLVVQVLILLGLSWRTRPRAVTHPPAPPHP